MADGRERLYEGNHVAVTEWMPRRPGESPNYQVTARDPQAQRTGNGYLVLPRDGLVELRDALNNILPPGV